MARFECPGCGDIVDVNLRADAGFRQVWHADGTTSVYVEHDRVLHHCDQEQSEAWLYRQGLARSYSRD